MKDWKDTIEMPTDKQYNTFLKNVTKTTTMTTVRINYPNTKKITYWRPPTKAEIKFGHGATHFRDFERHECSKPNGDLKKWFIADDGLRYNY